MNRIFLFLSVMIIISSVNLYCQENHSRNLLTLETDNIGEEHYQQPDTLQPFMVRDKFFAPDKAAHLVVSAILVGVSYNFYSENNSIENRDQRRKAAGGTAFGIGLGKELYDALAKQGDASYKDLLANFVGIGIGILIFTQ